jgi:hypothetical protein
MRLIECRACFTREFLSEHLLNIDLRTAIRIQYSLSNSLTHPVEKTMANGTDKLSMFRSWERNVLDVHHQSFSLWKRDRRVAIYGLLAQLDCLAVFALVGPPDTNSLGQVQILKNVEEGLTQGIRWLAAGQKCMDLRPTDDRVVFEEAGTFCKFAADYVNIADFHKMYGRELVELEIDEEQRRVKFVTPQGKPPVAALLGMFEQSHQLGSVGANPDPASFVKLGEEVSEVFTTAKITFNSGRVELVDISIANDERVVNLIQSGLPGELFPLAEDDDLVGFTVGEFGSFFRAIQRWSFCCTSCFLNSITKLGKSQWECAPTQCVERCRFISSMSQLSGLSTEKIETILARLSFDDRTKSPDIFQQPFFCGQTTVSWSCSVVLNSRFLRNMLKLMSRTKELQDHAATLIGSREQQMLRRLGDMFSRRGKSDYKLTTLITDGIARGEIDLLAYNRKFPEQVLIVEGKALLGVDEINEVHAGTKEMQAGQSQLMDAMRILSRLSDEDKARLFKFVNWPVVKQVHAVVVAAESEPNDKFDHSLIPGISLQTISARLRDKDFSSPQRFWQVCRERRWVANINKYHESHKSFAVGDVTYDLPVLVEPESLTRRRYLQELEAFHRPYSNPQRPRTRK